jgi:RNA methyltransferase, TrmH family
MGTVGLRRQVKETTPFNADQAIMMMILQCDEVSEAGKLSHDAGLSPLINVQSELRPLIEQGYILQKGKQLSLAEKGREAIAKIWFIHELAEQIIFHNIPDDEKQRFAQTIDKICKNCQQIVPFS